MQTKTGIFLKAALLLLMLMAVPKGFAQDGGGFVVVRDSKDTFVNLRNTDNTNTATVMARLKNGSVGYCFEKQGNWMMFEYMLGDSLVSGFVHNTLAKEVSGFQELKGGGNGKTATFTVTDIKVTLSQQPFTKNGHTFAYYKNDPEIIDKIDGKRFWGTDGGLPKRAYSEISVTFGSETVKFPKEAIADIFEPNYEFTKVYYDKGNDTLYITALNGDGAGGYAVAWVIENKKYRERTIAIPF